VKKEWRRKGIGRKLIEKLLENFKKEGMKIVFFACEGRKQRCN
jgi:predicted GNAT family acetyltransferase